MEWKVDPQHTSVEFTARHMMISKVRGHFREFEGKVTIDENNPELSKLEGTIQVDSLDTGIADRDAHLRSADLFNVEEYPTIRFVATNIRREEQDEYEVEGELTIRDVTTPVVWEVDDEGRGRDPFGNDRWAFTAKTEIDRRDFNITWNVPLDGGGVLVGNQIKVEVTAQFIKEPQPALAEAHA